jgi:hypothetical protein
LEVLVVTQGYSAQALVLHQHGQLAVDMVVTVEIKMILLHVTVLLLVMVVLVVVQVDNLTVQLDNHQEALEQQVKEIMEAAFQYPIQWMNKQVVLAVAVQVLWV